MTDVPEGYDEVVTDSGLVVMFDPPEVPAAPECMTYTDAPFLDHLCESTRDGHRCRLQWQGTAHVREEDGQFAVRHWCACEVEWRD